MLYHLKSFKIKLLPVFVLAALLPTGLMAQEDTTAQNRYHQRTSGLKISGRVSGQNGDKLAGATITEAGTDNAVRTDVTGSYQIFVTGKEAVLQFSYTGYKPQEIKVGEKLLADVTMEEIISDMNEVVVVGYGQQKKASVVGAISTIRPQDLYMTPSRSLTNNLAGLVGGLVAVTRTGDPYASNSEFWVRGVSTLGNSAALVLVDGVERNINDIDVEEIESFSVLKDASASAVYGVRGANGVLMVTTKRGKAGKPKVNFRIEKSYLRPTGVPEYVGAVKYLEVMNDAYKLSGESQPFMSQEDIDKYRNKVDPDLYPDVNWWDVISKDHSDNIHLSTSVNGGTDFLRYALTSGYFEENGLLERDETQQWNSGYKVRRFTMRSNVDVNLSKTTLMRFDVGGFFQWRRRPPMSAMDFDPFYEAAMSPPYLIPPMYSNGKFAKIPYRNNPWALLTQRGFTRSSMLGLQTTLSLEEDLKYITPGLKARAMVAFDKWSQVWVDRHKNPDYYKRATSRDANGNLVMEIESDGEQWLGWSRNSEFGVQKIYAEAAVNYDKVINNIHDLGAMVLYNQDHRDLGETLPYRTQGLAGRVTYGYDKKYLAEANFGYNGSENFAPGKRYGFFPSAAVGWVISEERFMQPLKSVLSRLKLRASYGKVGNANIGGRRFAYLPTIEDFGGWYRWGVDNATGRLGRGEGEIAVDNLTWETGVKKNLGLDVSLWGAFELMFDVFEEKRKDIFIIRENLPGSAGFIRAPWANYGKVNNRGFEVQANGGRQLTKEWFLSVLGSFTYNNNKVIERDEPLSIIGTTRARTGHMVGQQFGLIADGLYTFDDFDASGNLNPGLPKPSYGSGRPKPGDIKYIDLDGDGAISDNDKTAIGGSFRPQVQYGFGLNVRYRSIGFGFFFQGNGKVWQILGGQNWIPGSSGGAAGNILTNIDDRWTEEDPRQDAFWPRLSKALNEINTQPSTWWLRDMSFLKLRNIELSYELPKKLTGNIGMQKVQFFVRGSNLLTFSRFKLWDPELGTTDGLKYPLMKSLTAGFSLNLK
ncbi:SusC/RagA family TonB-linked outer membrane protein [Niabella drilacis]|uniref:TonB-linked outer membrane protein, SusC/RagA family n=1 Tax=Niabella drilacis (strain DSM 25811 / CCM 8410 / CCUG 62505 / LMG 26954 / E90) TaxID=1285928 RepID=A0A1G6JKY7_NIADE|nr:TonB-dependent receptor [Niabella drilacis]SDC19331.1 TonB-linked outer membrane protein, SusC/RagA family [Niabella drilacis]